MINIEEAPNGNILVQMDEPGRVEISGDRLLVFAYSGIEPDLDQEPDALFDSNSR